MIAKTKKSFGGHKKKVRLGKTLKNKWVVDSPKS